MLPVMTPGPITERKRATRSQRWLTHGPSRFIPGPPQIRRVNLWGGIPGPPQIRRVNLWGGMRTWSRPAPRSSRRGGWPGLGLGPAPEARGHASPALAEDYLHHVINRDDTDQPAVGVDDGQCQQIVPGERGAHRFQIILGGQGDDPAGPDLNNALVRRRHEPAPAGKESHEPLGGLVHLERVALLITMCEVPQPLQSLI